MTLVEALNGPISHIQSCVVPTAPLGYNIDSPHEVSTSLNSKVTRRSSRSSVAIQQVTIFLSFGSQGRGSVIHHHSGSNALYCCE